MWTRLAALLCLCLSLVARPASAAALPSCANPQDSARTLLDLLQPDTWDPAAAGACLGFAPGRKDDAAEAAVKLKEILDANGLLVPVTEMSLDPDYIDDKGLHRAVPLPSYPALAFVKRDGKWVVSRDLVQSVDRIYDETFSGLSGRVRANVPGSWAGQLLDIHTWQWVYLGVLFGVASLLGLMAQLLLADQVVRFAGKANIQLDKKVIAGTRWPLTLFVLGGVFVWGIPDVRLGVYGARIALFFANAVTGLAAVLILARVVNLGANFFSKRAAATASRMDDQVIPLVQRAAKVAIWLLGIVFVVQNLGVDVASLLAGLGIGGLAFALAAKDTVGNLFGSLTIFTDRPFQIGDWVVIDGDIEGVVEEVGFRSTRIRTFTSSIVSVPNGKVANSTIDNMGRRHYRRVKTTLGLTYGTEPERIQQFVEGVRAHLADNPAVRKGTCEVHFANFGPSTLDVMLYFFLDVPDWSAELRERAQCYYAFMEIARKVGVEFAFPSTSVYLESVPKGALLAPTAPSA